jgi:hypothetical protein
MRQSVGVELCWPYSPEQKGSVESLVGWVKGSFFKQRHFVDDEDLALQLAEWLDEVNTRRPSRPTKTIPAVRLAEERPRLRPLRVRPDELVLRFPVVVRPEGKVVHEARSYSMPPSTKGQAGTLFLGRDQVRIVVGEHVAGHRRLRGNETSSELPEHRVAHVEAARRARARLYLRREHLRRLGRDAEALLTRTRPSTSSLMATRRGADARASLAPRIRRVPRRRQAVAGRRPLRRRVRLSPSGRRVFHGGVSMKPSDIDLVALFKRLGLANASMRCSAGSR